MALFNHTYALSEPIGEFLKVDLHSHLIPGIDDGSQNLEMSLRLIRGLMSLGYQKLITTPHINDVFPNDPLTILNRFELLEAEVKRQELPVMLSYAAEYLLTPDLLELVDTGRVLCIQERYILVETLYTVRSQSFEQLVFNLRARGYEVILAHPERYKYIKSFSEIEKIFESGCLLQVNLLSLTGHYGQEIQKTAFEILDAGLCSFLATDLHHEQQLELLSTLRVDTKTRILLETINFRNNTFLY